MLKVLATLCFLSAAIVAAMQKAPSDAASSQTASFASNTQGLSHGKGVKSSFRSTQHRQKKNRERALKKSQTSRSALLDAAGLQYGSKDRIHWDNKKFARYLRDINEEDAQALIKNLIANKAKGASLHSPVFSYPSTGTPWSTRSAVLSIFAYNSKYAVLGGLFSELSSRNLDTTLDFIATLSSDPKNRYLEQYFYESILFSGYHHNPEKAWETYLAKCSSHIGFG